MPKKKAGEVENFYVSFSDLLSLLLIFFIYLFSIAEVNPAKYAEGSASVESEFQSTSELIEQPAEQSPDAPPAPSKSKSGIAQAIKDITKNIKDAIASKADKEAKAKKEEAEKAKAERENKAAGKDKNEIKQDAKDGREEKKSKEQKPGKDKKEGGKDSKEGKDDRASKEQKPNKDKKEAGGDTTPAQQAAKLAAERKALKDMKEQLDTFVHEEGLEGVVSLDLKSDQLGLTVRDNLMFSTGEAILIGKSYPILKTLADMLKKNKSLIAIEGYTDNLPIRNSAYPSNWELSAARAASVLRYLSSQGVGEGRFHVVGYGEFKPVAKNDTDANRAKNRRVKIILKVDVESIRPQKKPPKPAAGHH
jgi:flagellar motor protein MotB